MPPAAHLPTSLRRLTPILLLTCLIALVFAPLNAVTAAESDPTLQFSTYLGGDGNEFGEDIAVDSQGNIYVTGSTGSTNFPATDPFNASTSDIYGRIYVTKFDPTGTTQLYSIFLGSGTPFGIAVDAAGAAYVVGRAFDIPTVNALQATKGSNQDAFIAKVNPSGTALIYSTYLGGNGEDLALGVALDANRNVYISGATGSTNFPTSNPFQTSYGGGQWDIFLARLNAAGSALVYSTYYGGRGWDINMGIAVDHSGNAYITGDTGSDDFPTLNAYQPVHANWCAYPPGNPCTDVYVAKFSPSGQPIYSTYLGADGDFERGNAITVDTLGSAYVTGWTDSFDFPITANAYQAALLTVSGAAFVTKLSPDGANLIYSTYLGGSSDGSGGLDIALDLEGSIIIVGSTWAADFPTQGAIQSIYNDTSFDDAFVSKLSADGQQLLFSTYFGGSGAEYTEFSPRLAVDRKGSVYFSGSTSSNDFPTYNAFQDEHGGSSIPPQNLDAFVVKIDFPSISSPDEAAERNYFITHTPTLTWKPVTWALAYRVQVDKSQSFTLPYDFQGDALSSADSITTDDLDNGFYYWRIQTQKPDGSWTAWKVMDSFTVFVDD